MNKILIIVTLLLVNLTAIAQEKTENRAMVKNIELKSFTNRIAFEMGLTIVNLAKAGTSTLA